MFSLTALTALSLFAGVHAQQVGTLQSETHPSLTYQTCTSSGCTSHNGKVVLDSNWRWTHITNGSDNCYDGNEWDTSVCSDPAECAENCAIDGADYPGTYGIQSSGDALTLTFVTNGQYSTNIGSRVYLMDTDSSYAIWKLKNQEFTFDVDVSNLPCGLNGAVYFAEMEADGGMSKYSGNKAGAKYGTGYCDAQCPHDIKFINGEANVVDWQPSPNDTNAGSGKYGTCCNEMDIWEANSQATAVTPHTCTSVGQTRCEGTDCGDGDQRYDGVCDKDGCDFNSWRMGDQTFFGEGKTVDTTQVMTVVTQFITSDGTASGDLTEIRRIYVQNGQVIQNSKTAIEGMDEFDSITDEFCAQQKAAFNDNTSFADRGGMSRMGETFDNGMVLVLSLWDDHAANMLWLDSEYPLDRDASEPGTSRGPCSRDSGKPTDVESQSPDASVIYSNLRFGDLDSTYS